MRTYTQVRKDASDLSQARVDELRTRRPTWDSAEPSETDLRREELEGDGAA
jgi:hypothetical protein